MNGASLEQAEEIQKQVVELTGYDKEKEYLEVTDRWEIQIDEYIQRLKDRN